MASILLHRSDSAGVAAAFWLVLAGAAFLFLLTSALAPLIRLGYGRMLWMAVPYTITMSATGLLATIYLL